MGILKKFHATGSIIVIVLVVLVAALAPLRIGEYWQHVMIVGMYYIIMAASWNLLAGYTGQFSLAHQTFAFFY